MDVLDAQVQQGQQNNNGLLLIPGDIVDNGQVFTIMSSDEFKEASLFHKKDGSAA